MACRLLTCGTNWYMGECVGYIHILNTLVFTIDKQCCVFVDISVVFSKVFFCR
jgi:hypothetical protein